MENIPSVNTSNNLNTMSHLPEEYPMQENLEDISLFFKDEETQDEQRPIYYDDFYDDMGIGLFSDYIGIETQYVSGEDIKLPYLLSQPMGNDSTKPKPLIVFLHGDYQKDNDEWSMYAPNCLGGIMTEEAGWNLSKFNGYVLCPQSNKGWGDQKDNDSRLLLSELVEEFKNEHNISEVIAVAASSGAINLMDIIKQEWGEACFDKALIISAPWGNAQGTRIPVYAAAGTNDFALKNMKEAFGDNLIKVEGADHDSVVDILFRQDNDNDGISDILQLMLSDEE